MSDRTIIRLLEYTFPSDEILEDVYKNSVKAVPWNGSAAFGPTKIKSTTFLPDLRTWTTPDVLNEVIQAVKSEILEKADLVVAISDSGVQIVKNKGVWSG